MWCHCALQVKPQDVNLPWLPGRLPQWLTFPCACIHHQLPSSQRGNQSSIADSVREGKVSRVEQWSGNLWWSIGFNIARRILIWASYMPRPVKSMYEEELNVNKNVWKTGKLTSFIIWPTVMALDLSVSVPEFSRGIQDFLIHRKPMRQTPRGVLPCIITVFKIHLWSLISSFNSKLEQMNW